MHVCPDIFDADSVDLSQSLDVNFLMWFGSRGVLKAGTVGYGGGAKGAYPSTVRPALGRLGGLLDCLERSLTQPYSCPVVLPASAVLLLLSRILSMDDSQHTAGMLGTWFEFCKTVMTFVGWAMLYSMSNTEVYSLEVD